MNIPVYGGRRLQFSDTLLSCCDVTKMTDLSVPFTSDNDINIKVWYRLDTIGVSIIKSVGLYS